MKPKSANIIKLKFMDVSVELSGKRNIEQRAYSLLAAIVQDRFKMVEVMQQLNEFEDDEP